MGSTGSGKFGTYNVSETSRIAKVNIGGIDEITCPKIITNIKLEDVATSEYYSDYDSVPPKRTRVNLRTNIYEGRLVVEHENQQKILGNLPTQYNYLINCIKKEFYSGEIISSGIVPIPYIVVSLNA